MKVTVPSNVFQAMLILRMMPDLDMENDLTSAFQYLHRNGFWAALDWAENNVALYIEGAADGFLEEREVEVVT